LWVFDKKNGRYIDIVKNMYNGAITSVRTTGGETSECGITIDLHQRSTLSLYLFALVMDVPWYMLLVDDVVLIDETREGG